MVPVRGAVVRVFDGSLADARGLLRVERARFDESPYDARDVQAMLSEGSRRAWLAVQTDEVIGFIIAFPTHRLDGTWWEMDLLAVDPDWEGRGLGRRLIRAAASGGTELASRARAVVATGNHASGRAFSKAGFQPAPETHKLLIYRTGGLSPRPRGAQSVDIQEATNAAEALEWLAGPGLDQAGSLNRPALVSGVPGPGHEPAPDPALELPGPGLDSTFLFAKEHDVMAGFAEFVEVQTLLYRGLWLESLVAPEVATRRALIEHALEKGKTQGMDEVGAMVPEHNWLLQQDLLAEGFRSLGDFRWYTAELPLPGLASMGAGTPCKGGRISENGA